MRNRWLITGAHGQLGREWTRQMSADELILTDRDELDITDREAVQAYMLKRKPTALIHCAAYTKVDDAEKNRTDAYHVNADGTHYLAEACELLDIPMVYVSTDYVFDGTKTTPYIEPDITNPQSVYGASKLAGEQAVMDICDRRYVVRTAWLYGDGDNFVRTIIRAASEKSVLRVVDDQCGTPTSTTDLVWAIRCLLDGKAPYGIYHTTCQGATTWYGFAKEIVRLTGANTLVEPVTTAMFPRTAKRPTYSVLDNKRLRENGNDPMREWRVALADYLRR